MRHFVEYFDGRRTFHETYTHEITPEESNVFVQAKDIPAEYYAFRYFDMPDKIEVPQSAVEGVEFVPHYTRLNESGKFFPEGRAWSVEDVKDLAEGDHDQYRILYSNMVNNGWDWVCMTRTGNIVGFDSSKDVIL